MKDKPKNVRGSIYLIVFVLMAFFASGNSLTFAQERRKTENTMRQTFEASLPADNQAIVRSRVFRVGSGSLSSVRKVLIKLVCNSNPEPLWSVTDWRGVYRFGNLSIGDTCVATPHRVGYHFSPTSFQFLVFDNVIQGVDFNVIRDF